MKIPNPKTYLMEYTKKNNERVMRLVSLPIAVSQNTITFYTYGKATKCGVKSYIRKNIKSLKEVNFGEDVEILT